MTHETTDDNPSKEPPMHSKLRRAFIDTIHKMGGDDAVEFYTSLRPDLFDGKSSLEEIDWGSKLDELETFFPGFRNQIYNAWVGVLEDNYIDLSLNMHEQDLLVETSMLDRMRHVAREAIKNSWPFRKKDR